VAGAGTIIAVDLHADRLTLAKELGATHGVIGGSDLDKIVGDIRAICPPLGVDFAVDCAGVPIVVETMVAALGMNGRAATVGAPGPGYYAKIDIMGQLTYGKEYVGCSEGDSNPPTFIPYLIDLHRQGKLPLEKIIKYYDVKDFQSALHDAHSGKTVKAVLLWS
jgi:Zn-dependent alcohol dehydrogenase